LQQSSPELDASVAAARTGGGMFVVTVRAL
jgi:hypothetical protein